jgi:hypothetical protein
MLPMWAIMEQLSTKSLVENEGMLQLYGLLLHIDG